MVWAVWPVSASSIFCTSSGVGIWFVKELELGNSWPGLSGFDFCTPLAPGVKKSCWAPENQHQLANNSIITFLLQLLVHVLVDLLDPFLHFLTLLRQPDPWPHVLASPSGPSLMNFPSPHGYFLNFESIFLRSRLITRSTASRSCLTFLSISSSLHCTLLSCHACDAHTYTPPQCCDAPLNPWFLQHVAFS